MYIYILISILILGGLILKPPPAFCLAKIIINVIIIIILIYILDIIFSLILFLKWAPDPPNAGEAAITPAIIQYHYYTA